MDFCDALREFADMLTVASGALQNLAKQERGRPEIADLLAETDEIADRLRSIGDEIDRRARPTS